MISSIWLSTLVIAEELNLSRETVRRILTENLEISKISVQTV